ncbi:thymidine kinase 2, mitochondrial isoform X2 [Chelonus insularis]|nr:thymidine kinase 2, mitochondrial isoform X2 [Chelonus insularis]XP_034946288.1 thymidine kinase 2, mitochondrial isoform X2 [Chelonus insularis]XP_034946289.1 thymidine kinase 2, mitochondrial isoform X2 [Chelonus insularis]XP_034946290.1 thymidine kinase 2, mitochondrial isoform X2 [Chelonus insularis]
MVLHEPVSFWRDINGINLFNLMYKHPERYGCVFQSYVQLTFLELHTQPTSLPFKIMERSMYSARCFIENMTRINKIEKIEALVLEKWFEWCLKNHCIDLDLIVYLRTSPETVYERMKKRARKEEKSVSLEYLKKIHNIHEDWLLHRTLFSVPAPVIILNADQNFDEMLIEFQRCKSNIYSKHLN